MKHAFEKLPAFRINPVALRFQRQVREPVDAAQGRAQIMGDGVRKCFEIRVGALELHGALVHALFKLRIRFLQRLARCVALGEVVHDIERGRFALVGDRQSDNFNLNLAAVATDAFAFFNGQGAALFNHAAKPLARPIHVVGMHVVKHGFAGLQRIVGQAEQAKAGRIHQHDAFFADNAHRIR